MKPSRKLLMQELSSTQPNAKCNIECFARNISPEGVSPCPKKVKAILNLAAPIGKQELQSFLGPVNFLSAFIPNLSRKIFVMHSFWKKDSHFVWTSDMQLEFEEVKKVIASSVQLTHFDPNKPAEIETDASLKGF